MGSCVVVLNTDNYHLTSLLSDRNTHESLKRDPMSKFKKRVIRSLQSLEKQGVVDGKLPWCFLGLYPGDTTPSLYGLPKIRKGKLPSMTGCPGH